MVWFKNAFWKIFISTISMETVISSLNVRGLGNKQKRQQLFEWLDSQPCSIYMLQETHSNNYHSEIWKKEWKGESYFSGNKTNKEGVAILIKKDSNIKIVNTNELIIGRLISIDITINEREFTLLNIYGPNDDNISLFATLETFLLQNNDKNIIAGGDFNTVIDTKVDKKMDDMILIKNVEKI